MTPSGDDHFKRLRVAPKKQKPENEQLKKRSSIQKVQKEFSFFLFFFKLKIRLFVPVISRLPINGDFPSQNSNDYNDNNIKEA